ncbi:MAG: hypothetical protein CMJ78_16350 [Planctomycetaceae bacterium]|nr:hypothetical protein [Planctomycetaceae bacterium]
MNMQCVGEFEQQNVETPEAIETNNGGGSDLHVLWIPDVPDFAGGAEGYMFNAARLLRERGVRSTLMYDVNQSTSTPFLQGFDQSFPIVDLEYQIAEIAPDVCYVQRIHDTNLITRLDNVDVPVLRFIHDHKLFCLREHKYTTIGSQTCTQTMGLNCYSCLGFVGRSESWPGISLQTLSLLQKQQDANKLKSFEPILDYISTCETVHMSESVGLWQDRIMSQAGPRVEVPQSELILV